MSTNKQNLKFIRKNDEKRNSAQSMVQMHAVVSNQLDRDVSNGGDDLGVLETYLKEVWSQYMSCLEKEGYSDSTKKLKEKYLSLYKRYQRNKNWRELMTNN